MGVLYSANFNHEKLGEGKGEFREYKEMGGYSVEGLEQRVTYL